MYSKIKLMENYTRMKQITTCMRKLFGDVITFGYLAGLSFLSLLPQVLFDNYELSVKLFLLFYTCCIASSLVIAASAHAKVICYAFMNLRLFQ